ncbi:MAG TPA: hypothetical protein VGD98_06225 [Ktedonobacteraceae bacterium]
MTTTRARRLSRRGLLLIICAIALAAWGALLLFTYYMPISGPAILAVFILLSVALCCTCFLLTYLILQLMQRMNMVQAWRESGLISAWLIFNLALATLHSWGLFSAIVSFGIIIIIEALLLGRS